MPLEHALAAFQASTSSKELASLPALLAQPTETTSASALQESCLTVHVWPAARVASLPSMASALPAVLTVCNAQAVSAPALLALLDSPSMPAPNAACPTLNAHTARSSLMEFAQASATMDSSTMRASASTEAASQAMLITDSEDALALALSPLSPALPGSSSLTETVSPTAETATSPTTSARNACHAQPTVWLASPVLTASPASLVSKLATEHAWL